jgi:hypothetical protein
MKALTAGDWDLCKELARFLTSFDSISLVWDLLNVDTGNTLRQALSHVGLRHQSQTNSHSGRRTSGFMLVAEQSQNNQS